MCCLLYGIDIHFATVSCKNNKIVFYFNIMAISGYIFLIKEGDSRIRILSFWSVFGTSLAILRWFFENDLGLVLGWFDLALIVAGLLFVSLSELRRRSSEAYPNQSPSCLEPMLTRCQTLLGRERT